MLEIFSERQRTRDSLRALIQLRHGLQGCSTSVCFVASKAKLFKKREEVLGIPNKESKIT